MAGPLKLKSPQNQKALQVAFLETEATVEAEEMVAEATSIQEAVITREVVMAEVGEVIVMETAITKLLKDGFKKILIT